eukprot:TRINITY_DN1328_c0_g1_i2.p1 TRINITY_DN1328_c0_g1~~TRINITY_DN1328_c0_g1_i2.p1  ORF type:complete len:568 (+),score=192.61 TRINITY_DN1328_c0_g1_i2:26-1705(+)
MATQAQQRCGHCGAEEGLVLSRVCEQCLLPRAAPQGAGATPSRVAEFVHGPLSDAVLKLLATLEGFNGDEDFAPVMDALAAQMQGLVVGFFEPEAALIKLYSERQNRLSYRGEVLNELATTEQDYYYTLSTLLNVWQAEINASRLLSAEEMSTLFGNVQQLHQLAAEFYGVFQTCRAQSVEEQHVGQRMLVHIPSIRIYTEYLMNNEQQMALLESLGKNAKFVQLLEKIRQDPQVGLKTLDSYLVQPTQRIFKYPLFLKDLIKHTEPDHSDYKSLLAASAAMQEVLAEINMANRNRLTNKLLDKLQPNLIWKNQAYDLVASKTQLILGETLKMRYVLEETNAVEKGNTVYLFDRFILVCSCKQGRWQEIALFYLTDCDPALDEDTLPSTKFTLHHKSRKESLVFFPRNLPDRQHWITLITESLKNANVSKFSPLVATKQQLFIDKKRTKSRDASVDDLAEHLKEDKPSGLERSASFIALPPVAPPPVDETVLCPACGEYVTPRRFCPKCGAKMSLRRAPKSPCTCPEPPPVLPPEAIPPPVSPPPNTRPRQPAPRPDEK